MSTTTFTIGTVLDQARRMGAHDGTAHIIGAWMNARSKDLPYPEPHQWREVLDQLTEPQREAIRVAFRDAVAAAETAATEILEIVDRIRGWKLSGAEDRRFVAEVRCMIEDGDHALRLGHLREAHHHLAEAAKRLNWVVDHRGRNSARTYRHPHVEMVDEMHDTVDQLNTLADILGRAA